MQLLGTSWKKLDYGKRIEFLLCESLYERDVKGLTR